MSGSIAQIVYPGGQSQSIFVQPVLDWAHSKIFMCNTGTKLWSYAIPSPLATAPVLNGPTDNPDPDGDIGWMTVDSTGALLLGASGISRAAVYKLNPVTFAATGIFGTGGVFGSYPTSLAQSTGAASVTVGGVPYLAVKEFGIGNPNAGVIRTDNMTASGYYASVSGGDQGKSLVCAGKSGTTGTIFFADLAESGHPTAGVYKMTIQAAASSYNIASWPTQNTGITSALLVSLAAASVDATWTSISIYSLGYDAHDDLILLYVSQFGDFSSSYLVALNATTGAIVWKNLVPSAAAPSLVGTRAAAAGEIAMIGNGAASWLNGYNAGLTLTAFGLGTLTRNFSSDDASQYIVTEVSYTSGTSGAPTPVSGTPSSFSGWAILQDWPFNATPPADDSATLADLFLGVPTAFIDLSVTANRRRFVGVDGSSTYLGPAGAVPLGATPPVFLSRTPAGTADSFATNKGAGGNFTITGGDLAISGSSPPSSTFEFPISSELDDPPGVDPLVRLSFSDDGGRTFSLLQKWRSMGKQGEYTKRLRWLKMGQFRQRMIRLEITDPVRRNIVGVYLDVTEGMD